MSLGHREKLNRFLKVTKDSIGNLEVRNLLTDQLVSYHAIGSNSPRLIEQNGYSKQTQVKDEDYETDPEDSKYGMFFDISETELVDPEGVIEGSNPLEKALMIGGLNKNFGIPSPKASIRGVMCEMGIHKEGNHTNFEDTEYID